MTRWTLVTAVMFWALPAAADPPVLIGPTATYSSPEGACRSWVDANENSKLDKAERASAPVSNWTSGPPTETTTSTVDGLTSVTKIWRRPATEEDYIEWEEGRPVEERHTDVRNAAGQLVEERAEHSIGADNSTTTYEYDPDGRLEFSIRSGPGNSETWTSYEYDSDGYLARLISRTRITWSVNGGDDVRVVREGNVVVRLVRDGFYEASCKDDDEPEVDALCRKQGLTEDDRVETSRTASELVVTFEYDANLRVVARREIGYSEYSGIFAKTTRYSYDCR